MHYSVKRTVQDMRKQTYGPDENQINRNQIIQDTRQYQNQYAEYKRHDWLDAYYVDIGHHLLPPL
jgi:hypothetical protein